MYVRYCIPMYGHATYHCDVMCFCLVPMYLPNLDWAQAGALPITHILPVGTMFLIRNKPSA